MHTVKLAPIILSLGGESVQEIAGAQTPKTVIYEYYIVLGTMRMSYKGKN